MCGQKARILSISGRLGDRMRTARKAKSRAELARRVRRLRPGQQASLALAEKPRHGGKRRNAGRKSATGRSPVARVRRPQLRANHPVHVNWRVHPLVWSMRTWRCFRVMLRGFAAAADRFGMRITHFSVMKNHVHLIVEADGTRALTRGMQGLAIRLAKGLNKLMGRTGEVFADRYHAHPLETPTETRNAIAYVMNNARIHARRSGKPGPRGADEYAVSHEQLHVCTALWRRLSSAGPPVVEPREFMLREGWQRALPIRAAA